jgi:RimJ/RimL family protein N-acetyltransferase
MKHRRVLGVQIARLPKCMCDGTIELKALRISDGPFLGKMLRDGRLADLMGLKASPCAHWLFLWLLIRKHYCFAYSIRLSREPVGFIGLHDLKFGISARLGMVIPHEAARRRGYGTRALALLVRNLVAYAVVERVVAEIGAGNTGALCFARKMGFSEEVTTGSIVRLSLCLLS